MHSVREGKYLNKAVIGIGICLLLVVLYVTGTFVYKSLFAMEEADEERVVDAGQIESINVKTSSANIKVTSGITDQIKVKMDGEINKKLKDQYRLNVEEVNGQLVIEYLINENMVGIKFGSENDINISILLPKKIYQKLHVTTSSGNIEIENTVADNIELTTTSGFQSLIGSEIKGDATIQSSSGDIVLEGNTTKEFNIKTTSGRIKTKALVSEKGEIKTTSGDVTLNMSNVMKELQINTTSGNVEADYEKNPGSLRLVFEGESGKTDISLPGIMYEDKSENSATGVLGEGTNIFVVKTTSGDFIVH